MDKNQLNTFLKSKGRSASAIKRSLRALDAFNLWLNETRDKKIEDEINLEDLRGFIQSAKNGHKNLLLGLSGVFGFL